MRKCYKVLRVFCCMIVTRSLPFGEVKKELKKSDKIGVVACNMCARVCGTGGEKGMRRMVSRLKRDGYNVVDADLIGAPCDISQLQKGKLHGDVQVVLACDAGVYNLKKIFPRHRIVSGTETLGIGVNRCGKDVELVCETCKIVQKGKGK